MILKRRKDMEKYSDMYDCFVLANKLRNNNIGKKWNLQAVFIKEY